MKLRRFEMTYDRGTGIFLDDTIIKERIFYTEKVLSEDGDTFKILGQMNIDTGVLERIDYLYGNGVLEDSYIVGAGETQVEVKLREDVVRFTRDNSSRCYTLDLSKQEYNQVRDDIKTMLNYKGYIK